MFIVVENLKYILKFSVYQNRSSSGGYLTFGTPCTYKTDMRKLKPVSILHSMKKLHRIYK